MSPQPHIRLALPSRAENVALVRQALGGVSAAVGLEPGVLADLKTAVSEAANNVVMHAYDGEVGPMEVDIGPAPDGLLVVVRDRGDGILPHPGEPGGEMQGVGLSLITALTHRLEFRGGGTEGTEVRMTFQTPLPPPEELGESPGEQETTATPPPAGEHFISVASGPLAAPVLGYVIALLAARANFSLERVSDAQLVTDTLAAHAPDSILDGRVNVGIDCGERELDLRVGPLIGGDGGEIVRRSDALGIGPVLEQLSDDLRVEQAGEERVLHLVLKSPR